MSGPPCFASLARLPDRSTPCRPASAKASSRAAGSASNAFPSGLLPSRIGMAKPTIQQARDPAEVLWALLFGEDRNLPARGQSDATDARGHQAGNPGQEHWAARQPEQQAV